MNRLIFLFLIACVTALGAHSANPVFDNPDNRPEWGIRVAWDYNIPKTSIEGTNLDLYKPGSGLSVVLTRSLPIVANLYFEPGAGIYYDTYKDDFAITNPDGSWPDINDLTTRKFGFRIPLNLGYHFDIFENGSIYVLTGFSANIGISGSVNLDKDIADEIGITTNIYTEGYQHRFDLAWNIAGGVRVGQWQIEVGGSLGMLDVMSGMISQHEHRFNIGLGYNF